MTVKIVTDSVADIPPEVVEEFGISIIPIMLNFGDKSYRDGLDITVDEFFQKLNGGGAHPTTSVPSMDIFARTYARLAEETNEILVIMLSSKLSGIYNAAMQSAELVESKVRIEVVDSRWAVMAQGFAVIRAAQAAKKGASLETILRDLRRDLQHVDMRAAFDTLEYLKRGGRIGKAQALLGSLLNINPIITIREGIVDPAGRAHTRAKAIDHLYDFVAGYKRIEELAVEYGACKDDADRLVKRLGKLFPEERIYRSRATPVIGAHTGPGLLLVAVLGDN
jgi:DegV family protein with EDD domain